MSDVIDPQMKNSAKMLKILIADDHQLVIDGIKMLLNSDTENYQIGEANDGNEVLEILEVEHFDIVILDINMPGLNGIETCKRIRNKYENLKILILSMLEDVSVIKMMFKHGANGYLLKNAGKKEVIKAINTIQDGGTYYSPQVSNIMLDSLKGETKKTKTSVFPTLTRREKQVLRLIIDEYTTQEIAEKLFISFGTVETHRRNLLIKLGARNAAGLVRTALEYKLLDND